MSHRTQQHSNGFSALERRLLNDYQHGFPLSATPYADIAAQLGVEEDEVLAMLADLKERGVVSRVGPVFRPNRIGASTLAAIAVPPDRLEEVAHRVSAYDEVNHNYERDHRFNLWFVVTGQEEAAVAQVLEQIEQETGLPVMNLPMLEDYFIDLGFELQWT